jgi:hypothetical protein
MAEKMTKVAAPKTDAVKADAVKAVEAKAEPAKVEAPAEAKSEAPKNYSRGEGQKAVTQAYKDNWNAIYGKKKKKKS